jgi:PTS system nitrogen regulatory IIA component
MRCRHGSFLWKPPSIDGESSPDAACNAHAIKGAIDLAMKILDVLSHDAICADLQAHDKKGILEELAASVADIIGINGDELVRVLMERERLGSTGIGGGIGIPHGKLKSLQDLVLGFGISRTGVNFESMDGKPTHIFFLLLTPENSTGLHLKVLARISRILKNELFKEKLLAASTAEEIHAIIKEEDQEF